ncbi:peroxin 26 [Xylogone sp. PMI_703]|nr:peroxin 26 [Xylogone sp. PMI_703]
MASNGSGTTSLNLSTETLAPSPMISSSVSVISTSSRHSSSSTITKIYRQSSTLFLTRRLPEALTTILPVITPQSTESPEGATEPAPILTASRTTRVKVWSLYLTVLNAIVELDPDEGKQAFGSQEWRALVNKVREGEVWEEVVKYGYGGVEGNVDPDVVINLATLLLAHAPSQKLNQQRLEGYLAASAHPNLDVASDRLSTSQSTPRSRRKATSHSRGADTPRDLNARVKILELYTLHVLLRNNEWDYAREFISMNEVLDEERRDAFLQALESLHEEHLALERQEQEEQLRQEEQLQREIEESRRRRQQEEEEEERRRQEEAQSNKAGSETDYGIEASYPSNASNKSRSVKGDNSKNTGRLSRAKKSSPTPSAPPARKPVTPPQTLVKRATIIVNNFLRLLESMAVSFRTNPTILLRMLAFVVGLLVLLGRKDIRTRVKRIMSNGWNKVRATAGMGVKVSYI